MQFQADIINVPVVKPVINETTALGAAFAAGLAVNVWTSLDELRGLWREDSQFMPKMNNVKQAANWSGWKRAISKSLGWVVDKEGEEEELVYGNVVMF